jgi:DNA topoisomerase-1
MRRLVIVESPTKARTIRNFLPKGYTVEACMGHVRDLPSSAKEIPAKYKNEAWARLGVDVNADFAPLYVIPSEKKKLIKELKDKLKNADELLLATDEDREGESIGWHLVEVLKPNIPIRRMVFHEITREAIEEAVKNPREIDQQLVRAQETRRILDRLVGYTVSPLLWKKIAPGLSAGRVQSVAVALLVSRETERMRFRSGTYWDLRATLDKSRQRFSAILQSAGGKTVASGKDFDESTGQLKDSLKSKRLLLDEQGALALRQRLVNGQWQVTNIQEKEQKRQPPPPFTTSTLQQEANRKLNLSARDTMRIAQKLYEQGYITYMRTDSTHLSQEAIDAARKTIRERYGQEYLSDKPRQYRTKSKGAQEAHEAIRPAGNRMRTADELGLDGKEWQLYDMIWKRALATQMADAHQVSTTVTIAVEDAIFQTVGKRILFPGFLRVYVEGSDDPDAALDDQEVLLPHLQVGDEVICRELEPIGHETKPPARFTEASLVQSLEKEGVGRPSTYASIISTIQERGYVQKQGNTLVPTFVAFAVNRLLTEHFPELVDTKFTAHMEEVLDEIATGEADWLPYLTEFYLGDTGLEQQVEQKDQSINPRDIYALDLDEIAAKVRIGRYGPYLEQENGEVIRASVPENLPPAELNLSEAERLLKQKDEGPRIFGYYPATGEPIYLLEGPYGHYVQLGDGGEKAKPKRVSLPRNLKPEDVTKEIAIQLLDLPRSLGQDPDTGEPIEAGIGRYGPYVKRGSTFQSLQAQDSVFTIGLERALELLNKKQSGIIRELGVHPEDGQSVSLNQGRYGPYIKHGRTNAALPKGVKLEEVNLDVALEALRNKQTKKTS